jgi:DNA-binding NarL/FixJ family response regulator
VAALNDRAQILIVEDQSLIRQALRMLIEENAPQYRIHEEASYEGALQALSRQCFEIAFLDIDLGGPKSGLDLLEFIKSGPNACRVIMLSGDDDRSTIAYCLAHGAAGYISKAADDGAALGRAISAVTDNEIFLSDACGSSGATAAGADVAQLRDLAALGLSPRKCEVLYYLCQGLSNKAIANRMGIEEATVRKSYVTDLLRSFGVTRRTELMAEISRRGLRLPVPTGSPKSEG